MSEKKVHRIGIVDDHEIMRFGVAQVLNAVEDIVVVATAPDVTGLLSRTNDLDLVLLDLNLHDGSLPEQNARRLADAGIPSVAYTSGEDAYLLRSAARGGVRCFLDKSLGQDDLVAAIRAAVLDDVELLTQEWASALDSDPELSGIDLSPRQRQVLELFASGEPAKRVASITGLSQPTVNVYLLRIRAKYAAQGRQAATKVELYQRALEDGVLPVPTLRGRTPVAGKASTEG